MNENGTTDGHETPAARTTRSATIGKIVEALAKANGAMEHARKNSKNPHFGNSYADLAACIEAARIPLSENGLAVVQLPTTDELGNVELITTLAHISGEWFESRYPIRPTKPDPQGYGSAITYARRYTFQAITGQAAEDDDGNTASGRDAAARVPLRPTGNGNVRPTAVTAPVAPSVPPRDEGAFVFDVVTVGEDGTRVPVSKRYHGRQLRDIHRADPSVLPRLLESPRYRNDIPEAVQHIIRAYLLRLEREKKLLTPTPPPASTLPAAAHRVRAAIEEEAGYDALVEANEVAKAAAERAEYEADASEYDLEREEP